LSATTERALEIALDAFKRGDKIAGVTTGFADLDKVLGGLHRSDLVILAGRPSMGKTALAENIARNASKAGKSVGFFSLEMANEQLGSRVLAGESGIPADWVRRADLNQQHFDKLLEAKRQTDDLPLYIDDTPGLSVDAMHARARRWKRQHGLDLIVIDYLQLAQAPRPEGRRDQNRVQEVSEITARSKRLAKDLGVPVLALSQLSRGVENRDDKRPLLADLRDSGSIEQDADVVMFLFRKEYYLQHEPTRRADEKEATFTRRVAEWRDELEAARNKAALIIAKNRHGATGSVELHFDGRTTQFSNLARGF
jgi:replicative DNA helicase